MAIDKAVDSSQLNAGLKAVADALRSKGGTSDALTFPGGFVDAVGAIQSGGGDDSFWLSILDRTIAELNTDRITSLGVAAFRSSPQLVSVNLPSLTSVSGNDIFYGCPKLKTVRIPQITHLLGSMFAQSSILDDFDFSNIISTEGNVFFNTGFTEVVLPKITRLGSSLFSGSKKLKKVDLGQHVSLPGACFSGCSVLDTIILRGTQVHALQGMNTLSSTPFASGGAGGTIYIPKVLYDELGTGSSLDYKAATNWSTYDAYGTITWAQIEGSEYE